MPPANSPPVRRRIGASRTALLACSALLALSSFAIAGLTGSGAGAGLHHARRHDETHRALRQGVVDAAGVLRRATEDNDDDYDGTDAGASSSSAASAACTVEGSPNPISSSYPNDVSGNLNGTAMIVPIPLAQARAAVPAEYGLLESQWRRWLPEFPEGMYPMLAVGVYDHDLRFPAYNLSTPDFMRAGLEFPFVDVLNDGHSAFRWAANMLLTAGSPAVAGSEAFGLKVYPAAFDPVCNAYRRSPSGEPGVSTFRAWEVAQSNSSSSISSSPSAAFPTGAVRPCSAGQDTEPWKNAARSLYFETRPSTTTTTSSSSSSSSSEIAAGQEFPYPLNFLVNITNQPVFATPSICDNYKRLFNTTLTTDPANAPVEVVGTVAGAIEPFGPGSGATPESGNVWPSVYGWRIATAFLEPPVPVTCEALKGYMGTGSGDSALPP